MDFSELIFALFFAFFVGSQEMTPAGTPKADLAMLCYTLQDIRFLMLSIMLVFVPSSGEIPKRTSSLAVSIRGAKVL